MIPHVGVVVRQPSGSRTVYALAASGLDTPRATSVRRCKMSSCTRHGHKDTYGIFASVGAGSPVSEVV